VSEERKEGSRAMSGTTEAGRRIREKKNIIRYLYGKKNQSRRRVRERQLKPNVAEKYRDREKEGTAGQRDGTLGIKPCKSSMFRV